MKSPTKIFMVFILAININILYADNASYPFTYELMAWNQANKDDIGIAYQIMKGTIAETEEKSSTIYTITIEKIARDAKKTTLLLKCDPFIAKIMVNKGKCSLTIIKGKMANQLDLSNQYRIAYAISDLLLISTITKEIRPCKNALFLIADKFQTIETTDFGVISIKELRSAITPSKFRIQPLFEIKYPEVKIEKWQLSNFRMDGFNIQYSFKKLNKSLKVLEAVEIEGSSETELKNNEEKGFTILASPEKFLCYRLHKIKLGILPLPAKKNGATEKQ